MKKNFVLTALLTFLVCNLSGQVTLIGGSLDFLKADGMKIIKVNYFYDGLKVRDMPETDYINKWVTKKNEKEPGMGDQWKEKWIKDREYLYEPSFQNSFNATINYGYIQVKNEADSASYILKVKTYYVDPGFALDASNGGSLASNLALHAAGGSINCYLQFSNAANPGVLLALIKLEGAGHFGGCVDEGIRMAENYASCGRMLAEFFNKKLKK